jgi:hypothetical protein
VFASRKPEPASQPQEFGPLEHIACDDELVYPTSCHMPALCFTRKLGGRKSLTFEALLVGCYCEVLLDSGATNSFVSLNYMIDNGILYAPIQMPDATLADGSPIPIAAASI